MNNEFNNQNMNQFQNNNMNDGYSSNYNSLNNQNNKGNNGLIVVLVIIIVALAGVCLYLVLDKKDNDADTNKDNNIQENENNKKDEYIDSDQVKIEINKKLQESGLSGWLFESIMGTYGIYDLNEITKLNDLFENDMSKFVFTKAIMDKEKLTNWDTENNENKNFYDKCDGGTGAISIEETVFNEYYKKLFGIDFDKTKINVNVAKFVDGYICTSMPTGYTAGIMPVLKTISKVYNASSDTYKIEMISLGSFPESYEYSESEILEWPFEKEKAKLTLTYKRNSDNSYQIVSFIVNPK